MFLRSDTSNSKAAGSSANPKIWEPYRRKYALIYSGMVIEVEDGRVPGFSHAPQGAAQQRDEHLLGPLHVRIRYEK